MRPHALPSAAKSPPPSSAHENPDSLDSQTATRQMPPASPSQTRAPAQSLPPCPQFQESAPPSPPARASASLSLPQTAPAHTPSPYTRDSRQSAPALHRYCLLSPQRSCLPAAARHAAPHPAPDPAPRDLSHSHPDSETQASPKSPRKTPSRSTLPAGADATSASVPPAAIHSLQPSSTQPHTNSSLAEVLVEALAGIPAPYINWKRTGFAKPSTYPVS